MRFFFFFFFNFQRKMKPAGGYYLLYLTRTDRLTRDRPTGYLFNHFYFLSCVCVCRASLCLARSSREAEKVTTRTNKTKRNARFLFLFLSLFSLSTFLFRVSEEENHENKKQKQKKIQKMFFFVFGFFLCMFFSVCPAAGCRWRGHQIHTRTGQRETHQNRFSDNVISSQRESPAVYTHKATNMLGFLFSFSPISLFFEIFLV